MRLGLLRVGIAGIGLMLSVGCERPINRDDDVDVTKLAASFECAQPRPLNPEGCRLVKEFTAGIKIGTPTAEMAHMAGERICTEVVKTRSMHFVGVTPPFQFRAGYSENWVIGHPEWASVQAAVNAGTPHPSFGDGQAKIDVATPTGATQSNGTSMLIYAGTRAVWWDDAKTRGAMTYLRKSSAPGSNATIAIDWPFTCITEYKPITM